ncbi:RmlC-like cupin [Linnemannia elongata AG-77]|uniref:RmlC-like cupin n=1 Tax=Linnemannia elongata AG-77 TaxID=1314771 RepID=A0A197JHN8_9FUNG|nr:RmlC-like cupin [Linnemannia elongata AG-77]
MLPGCGIVYSEMSHEDERTHWLQLWTNLPKEHKMCEPQYQELLDGQTPCARPQDGVFVKVIAGESHGVKSHIYTRTPTMLLDFKMDKNQTVTQTIPAFRQHATDSFKLSAAPHILGIPTARLKQKRTIPSSSPRMVPAPSGSRQRMRQRIL